MNEHANRTEQDQGGHRARLRKRLLDGGAAGFHAQVFPLTTGMFGSRVTMMWSSQPASTSPQTKMDAATNGDLPMRFIQDFIRASSKRAPSLRP